ncbi:hypothetical protein Tco_0982446 [Tanacetum coccineum]
MVAFRQLYSHLKLLSNNDLKGTRTECGFKRAFATLFGQDVETFTGTMFLNVNQLEKQLDKEEFQEIGSMAAFQEKRFAIAALKNELRKLKGNSVNTKFAKSSILGKPVLQSLRNQSVVRKPTAFKSERPRISRPRFASQVDVNNDLSKPVTSCYLPKGKESAYAKPQNMIAPGSSRYNSNDMVYNHYLEEAKKQTQEIGRNSKTSVMPSARSKSATDGSKPKPRINNQKYRNWPTSKSSCVTTKTVPIAERKLSSDYLSFGNL